MTESLLQAAPSFARPDTSYAEPEMRTIAPYNSIHGLLMAQSPGSAHQVLYLDHEPFHPGVPSIPYSYLTLTLLLHYSYITLTLTLLLTNTTPVLALE